MGERYKRLRGMATTAANNDRTDTESAEPTADEGVETLTPLVGSLESVTTEFLAGIRSGLSYVGAESISAAREKAEFIQIAPGARRGEGAHFDHDWETTTLD